MYKIECVYRTYPLHEEEIFYLCQFSCRARKHRPTHPSSSGAHLGLRCPVGQGGRTPGSGGSGCGFQPRDDRRRSGQGRVEPAPGLAIDDAGDHGTEVGPRLHAVQLAGFHHGRRSPPRGGCPDRNRRRGCSPASGRGGEGGGRPRRPPSRGRDAVPLGRRWVKVSGHSRLASRHMGFRRYCAADFHARIH